MQAVVATTRALFRRAAIAGALAALAVPQGTPASAQVQLSHAEALRFYDAAHDRWRHLPRPPFVTYDAAFEITRKGRVRKRRSRVFVRTHDRLCRIVGVPVDAADRPDATTVSNRCFAPDTAFTFLPGVRESAGPLPIEIATPEPAASDEPREIGSVSARARAYDVTSATDETVNGIATVHLTLRPYRDPGKLLIRDAWVDRATYGVVRLHGIASLAGGVAVVDFFADYAEDATTQTLRHFGGFAKAQLLLAKTGADFAFDITNVAYPASLPEGTFDPRSPSK